MDKIRVLLANTPVIVPDAIRELVGEQEDMELVADCRGPMKILQETGRTKADAVIFAQEGTEELGLCGQLLAVYPDITIVSLVPDKRSIFAQKLCFRRRNVVMIRQEDIIHTLRSAVKDTLWSDLEQT